jgi:hypothetical protein
LFNGEAATLITFFSGNSRNLKNKGLEIVMSISHQLTGQEKIKKKKKKEEIVGICKQKLEIRCLEIVGSEL